MKNFTKTLLAVSVLAFAASPSFAAIDIASATTGVTDAQTAVLAVIAVMITMGAAIFGVRKVMKLFGR